MTPRKLKVYPEIPKEAVEETLYVTLREAIIPETFRRWHYCPTCEGWIAGSPQRRKGREAPIPLSPGSEFIVTGPRQITFHCQRCNTQLARKHHDPDA